MPEINPKESQIYKLPDKKIKVTIIMMLNKLKQNTDQYTTIEIMNIIHEQNENVNKEKR